MDTTPPPPIAAKFRAPRAARPMMARDADSMYWMSRYVERCEHVARLLLVNANLLMDVGDLAPSLLRQQWQSVLSATRTEAPPELLDDHQDGAMGRRVGAHMAFHSENPNSLVSCLTRARENAHIIRENISAEMWESLNSLYWSIRSDEAPGRFEESSDDFYRQIITGSMLFQGLTDQTLPHDQRWHFAQLGKYLERIDVTARVIETKFAILRGVDSSVEAAMRNIQCVAVLRSCCSIEAYRRHDMMDMRPVSVASFLLLESKFPRSILYAVGKARDSISFIRSEVNALGIDPAERILGRLHAQLQYAEVAEMVNEGLPAYLRKIEEGIAAAAMAVQRSYFLHR